MLSEDKIPSAIYQIKSYSDQAIQVNEQALTNSFIISQDQLQTDWPCQDLSQLDMTALLHALPQQTELLLIGTGNTFKPLPQALVDYCRQQKIAIEGMNSVSACRTYMALLPEGRQVSAAIIFQAGETA